MPRKKTVTLQMLADELGLSLHTVSKALRGKPGMSEETRRAVSAAARKLGYRTKEQEHSLQVEHIPLHPHRLYRFKLVFYAQTGSFRMNQMLLEGLQEKLAEYGHTIDMVMLPTAFDNGKTFEAWVDSNNLAYADGLFISPLIRPAVEEQLLELPFPRILLNFPPPDAEVDSVVWDVGAAVRQSVRHLLASGHRDILYVGNIHGVRGFRLRWQSFVETMREAGLEADPEQHMTTPLGGKGSWIDHVQSKLASTRATAILNGVHLQMAWIYHACSLLGKQIPRDLSLVSLQHEADDYVPQLSRPLLCIREAGMRGAERMLWRLANPSQPYEHILLQGTFFKGETVQPLKKQAAYSLPAQP